MNPFEELPCLPGKEACKLQTGYSPAVLLELYNRYHDQIFVGPEVPTGKHFHATQHHKIFYLIYVYIHKVNALAIHVQFYVHAGMKQHQQALS